MIHKNCLEKETIKKVKCVHTNAKKNNVNRVL
ncbi:DUF6501 family protein, partial [Bacillus subtilis]